MQTKLKFNFVSEKARDTDPKEPNHSLSMFSWLWCSCEHFNVCDVCIVYFSSTYFMNIMNKHAKDSFAAMVTSLTASV